MSDEARAAFDDAFANLRANVAELEEHYDELDPIWQKLVRNLRWCLDRYEHARDE